MKHQIFCLVFFLIGVSFFQDSFCQELKQKGDKKPLTQEVKNPWSLGLRGGVVFIGGEVKSQGGVGYRFAVKKSLGRFLLLRLQVGLSSTKGMNHTPSTGYAEYGNSPWTEIYYSDGRNAIDFSLNPPAVFYNFRMKSRELDLQAIFNLNDFNSYHAKHNWNIYGALGAGIRGYSTKIDAGRGSKPAPYDFVPISPFDIIVEYSGERKDVINALKGILDGVYESEGQTKGNKYTLIPTLSLGTGFQYRLGEKLSVAFEYSLSISSDDLLDSVESERIRSGLGMLIYDYDRFNLVSIGLDYQLANK